MNRYEEIAARIKQRDEETRIAHDKKLKATMKGSCKDVLKYMDSDTHVVVHKEHDCFFGPERWYAVPRDLWEQFQDIKNRLEKEATFLFSVHDDVLSDCSLVEYEDAKTDPYSIGHLRYLENIEMKDYDK